jgi:hypothetical protein
MEPGYYMFPLSLETTGLAPMDSEYAYAHFKPSNTEPSKPIVLVTSEIDAVSTSSPMLLEGAGNEVIAASPVVKESEENTDVEDKLNAADKEALKKTMADAEAKVVAGPLKVHSFELGKRKVDKALEEEGYGKKSKARKHTMTIV